MTQTKTQSKQNDTNSSKPATALDKVKEVAQKAGKKGGSAQMMGATAGAVVGAAVGGVAGAVLADEKTRKDVGQKISEFTKSAADTAEKLSDKAMDVSAIGKESINELADDVDKLDKETKKAN